MFNTHFVSTLLIAFLVLNYIVSCFIILLEANSLHAVPIDGKRCLNPRTKYLSRCGREPTKIQFVAS
jgi:hypothetical protein